MSASLPDFSDTSLSFFDDYLIPTDLLFGSELPSILDKIDNDAKFKRRKRRRSSNFVQKSSIFSEEQVSNILTIFYR
jgi:type IV secretory pathway VirD2 relaxase